jgi:hypothetical protein
MHGTLQVTGQQASKNSGRRHRWKTIENHSIYGDKSLDYVAGVCRMKFNGGNFSSYPS